MDEIFKIIQTYPKTGAAIVAVVFSSFGWVFRNLFQIVIDHWKYQTELKTFFWKEKINAAKKASEFYYENLNFLNLVRIQFELYETGKIGHQELIERIENDVNFYSVKLKSFPHYEYHHINMFYDFNESRSMEITNKSIEIQQKIQDLISDETINEVEFDLKIKEFSKALKENYSELFKIHKGYVKLVREDIKKNI